MTATAKKTKKTKKTTKKAAKTTTKAKKAEAGTTEKWSDDPNTEVKAKPDEKYKAMSVGQLREALSEADGKLEAIGKAKRAAEFQAKESREHAHALDKVAADYAHTVREIENLTAEKKLLKDQLDVGHAKLRMRAGGRDPELFDVITDAPEQMKTEKTDAKDDEKTDAKADAQAKDDTKKRVAAAQKKLAASPAASPADSPATVQETTTLRALGIRYEVLLGAKPTNLPATPEEAAQIQSGDRDPIEVDHLLEFAGMLPGKWAVVVPPPEITKAEAGLMLWPIRDSGYNKAKTTDATYLPGTLLRCKSDGKKYRFGNLSDARLVELPEGIDKEAVHA